MKYISGNGQLLIVFGSFILLAFLVGQERMKRVALATIVAMFVCSQLGMVIYNFISRYHYLSFVNKSVVYIVLFGAITLLLSLGHVESSRQKGISVPAIILAVLTAGMLISSGIELLPESIKTQLTTEYNLYAMIVAFKNWWLGLTVVWLIAINLWHRPEKKR